MGANLLGALELARSMNYSLDKEIDDVLNEEVNRQSRQSKILENRAKVEQSAIDVLVTQLSGELNDVLGDNLFKALNLQFSSPNAIRVLSIAACFQYRQHQITLSIQDNFDWVISGFGENVVSKYESLKQDLMKLLAVIKSSPVEAVAEVENPAPDSNLTNVATPEASPVEAVAEVENPAPDSDKLASGAA